MALVPSFASVVATTVSSWCNDQAADAILGNIPVLNKLRETGSYKPGTGDGTQYVEPFMFPAASGQPAATGQTAGGVFTAVTFSDITNFGGAIYTVAEYNMPAAMQLYNIDAQGSSTKKVDLVELLIEDAKSSFMGKINTDLWATEEDTAAGSRAQLQSIRQMFNGGGASATSAGSPAAKASQIGALGVGSTSGNVPVYTVGGVPRNAAGAAHWCTPNSVAETSLSVQALSSIMAMGTRNNEKPNLIIMHPDSYARLEHLATIGGTSGGQLIMGGNTANLGLNKLFFKGAEIISDDNCPSVTYLDTTIQEYSIFAINTKYLKLRTNTAFPVGKQVAFDGRPILAYTFYWKLALTSGHLGNVHARHSHIKNS